MNGFFIASLQFAGTVNHCSPNGGLRPDPRLIRDKARTSEPIPVLAQSRGRQSAQLIAVPARLHVMAKSIVCFLLLSGTAFSYTISGKTYLTDGSQADVQAACSAASDDGSVTVIIPNGTYSWSGNLTITNSLTLAGASSGGVTIKNNNASGDLIDATSSAHGHINIYWLNFVDVAQNGAGVGFTLNCDRTEPSSYTVLVHDCTFNNANVFTYMVSCGANGIIFWNDTFIGDGSDGLGGITFTCQKYDYTSSLARGNGRSTIIPLSILLAARDQAEPSTRST
jgi:hypothetical protein